MVHAGAVNLRPRPCYPPAGEASDTVLPWRSVKREAMRMTMEMSVSICDVVARKDAFLGWQRRAS